MTFHWFEQAPQDLHWEEIGSESSPSGLDECGLRAPEARSARAARSDGPGAAAAERTRAARAWMRTTVANMAWFTLAA